MKYGELGGIVSVDTGSRHEDPGSVVAALVEELIDLRNANGAYDAVDTLEQALEELITDVLEPGLNDYAPPYCSFGKQNGEYGFWVDHSSLDEAVYDGTLLKVDDLSEVPEDYVGDVLHVSDHGNLSCGYIDESTKEFVETWSCV